MHEAAGAQINWLAALAGAVSAFGLGALWYSPALFGRVWMREAHLSPEALARGNAGLIFGLSFVLALIASLVFATFLGPNPALGFAVAAGGSAGLCWVAASFGINYLFERKSLVLFFINGGYHTAQFAVYGLILGLWH